jgi:hypothetical protein
MFSFRQLLAAASLAALASSASAQDFREPIKDAPAKSNASQAVTPATREAAAASLGGAQGSEGGSRVPGVTGRRVVAVPGADPSLVPPPPPPLPAFYPIQPEIWTAKNNYALGESIEFFFASNKDSYIYIFNTDAAGYTSQIFPNFWDRKNHIRAGYVYKIPTYSPDKYHFRIQPPTGRESVTILAVADRYEPVAPYYNYNFTESDPFPTNVPSPFEVLNQFEVSWSATVTMSATGRGAPAPSNPRANDGTRVEGATGRRVVAVPGAAPVEPSYEFGAATLHFTTHEPRGGERQPVGVVVPPPPPPRTHASLEVTSAPSDSLVLLDGYRLGRTPLKVDLAPGEYEIVVRHKGFWTEVRSVKLSRGEDAVMSLKLKGRSYGRGPLQGYPSSGETEY